MQRIQLVSHEKFPDDPYTKELVYLLIDEKYRVAYVKKENKNGGSFWVAPGVSAVKDGSKQHFPAFLQDSAFLEKDIKLFLDKKPWETITPISMDKSQEIPF